MAFRPKLSEKILCNLHPYTSGGAYPLRNPPLSSEIISLVPSPIRAIRVSGGGLGTGMGDLMLTRQG